MMDENIKKDIDKIAEWVEKSCNTYQKSGTNNINSKIDFLERALELLRIKNKYLKNNLDFEEFISGSISYENNILNYSSPKKIGYVGSGIRPIRLQPKLLMFLLINHKRTYQIYDIIEKFIKEIWGQLSIVDFKKTKTGVTRCFTNTRFAANTLRNYGLLKFTKKEAYKTWTLSLYGFLVASKIIQDDHNWEITNIDKRYVFDLHPDILEATSTLNTYDEFVQRLKDVCEPNKRTKIFKTFDVVLNKAYTLLEVYSKIIQDKNLSKTDRQKESQARLKFLEQQTDIENFYKEFSVCVYVESFVNKLLEQ
jgi:hypothetical protein